MRYKFKVVTESMDYIEVEAGGAEEAKDIALERGRQLHPRKTDHSGPQGSSTEIFINGADYMLAPDVESEQSRSE